MRRVIAIPLKEVRDQFESNSRQDIKIIAPEMLSAETYSRLVSKGKSVKRESTLEGISWQHSPEEQPNLIVEAREFIEHTYPQFADGPFCIAFANEKAVQDEHYHLHHAELYYSQAGMFARYRPLESAEEEEPINLPDGGIIIFGPRVVHTLQLKGLTLVVEFPAVARLPCSTKNRKRQRAGRLK